MAGLIIRLTKRAPDEYVLTCRREDGTVTRAHYRGPTARFFPGHDLTHWAVETVLGCRRGFYGLVLEGWNLTDFGSPWPRGKLPADADPVEAMVGLLDREAGEQRAYPAAEVNVHIGTFQSNAAGGAGGAITEAQLQRIREKASQLTASWVALPMGETLELRFERPATSYFLGRGLVGTRVSRKAASSSGVAINKPSGKRR